MKMKVIAGFAFLLNTMLFATYYAVAKEALGRIDPIVFTFFEMTTLAPIALAILAFTYQHMTWALVKRGVLLGSCLCLALFTIAIALKYSTATGTAFFPALNGFLAALTAWLVLRQPMNKATWCAGILSLVGTALLMGNSEMGGLRGAIIAFLGGIFFTLYVFLSDYTPKELEKQKTLTQWPLLAVELLTMALWASLVALLFGDWQAFHPAFPKDALVILYISVVCTFLPTLIAVLLQKHVSAVTVSFIYILEPVLGVVAAYFYLHEVLPLAGYLGGGLVVVGAFVHTWGSIERPMKAVVQEQQIQTLRPFVATLFGSYLAPLLYCCSGFLILYGLGGFPPLAWRELAPLAPILLNWLHPEHRAVASAVLNTLLQGPQKQSFLLLLVQALCWLIGWSAFTVLVCMTLFHVLQRGKGRATRQRGRNKLKPLQSRYHDDFATSHRHVTDAVNAVPTIMTNAIWGGPLEYSMPKDTMFDIQYDVQDVTTDELPPIMPVFSMPMNQGSREYSQHTNRVKLVEYVEEQREEVV